MSESKNPAMLKQCHIKCHINDENKEVEIKRQ